VLFIVGTVNRDHISTFKRTSKYTTADYELLVRVLADFQTALYGSPRLGRGQQPSEAEMPSARAAEDVLYPALGLTDAAIGAVARAHNCTVLTDDFDLYRMLSYENANVIYFTYLRAQELEA
jgi:hypothetical protein